MSKHPIPDWLRSQFSRIEDEVQKLGPCGVFTQMRTVTQTYFEQQAEAAQPPALGGEHETFQEWWDSLAIKWSDPSAKTAAWQGFNIGQAKIAPLQAEIEHLRAGGALIVQHMNDYKKERDQLQARCDELEHRAADVVEGFDSEQLPGAMTMRIRKLKAALSKPAGSDQ